MSSESFRDKLRRLRREADPARATPREPRARAWQESAESVEPALTGASGAARESSATAEAAPPTARGAPARDPRLAERLARRARLRGEPGSSRQRPDTTREIAPRPQSDAGLAAATSCERTSGAPERLERSGFAHTTVHARTTAFAVDHRHGDRPLCEVAGAEARAFELLTGDAALGSLDPLRVVYLDTETTGLSGGAGTYVYLVGLGTFDGERFRVWQGFLRDPSGERALLEETAARIRAAPGVVSFFGKAFDRHRLEDKMRLHRIEPPFGGRAHLDLYHPLRRLYRASFEDARLRTFESRLCGIARANDLPGAFAPAAWFDFLAGRPHRLEAVFRHNEDDVLSLVALAGHLGSVLRGAHPDGTALGSDAASRAEAIARSFASAREHAEALAWTERAITAVADARSRRGRALRLARVELLRRLRRPMCALAEAQALCDEPEDDLSAAAGHELARLCELELGCRDRARDAVARARAALERRNTGAEHARLARGLARLEQRFARGGAAQAPERPPAGASSPERQR